ncbi:MAG: hypothetical protein CBD44_00635 [Flavobacteriaceae bacterium TMED184]|nr:MAG: hypothetical protein CBD44_00635 [Flavobacteriaceae bacterium TMED184]|tara:strand:+ start:138 stop:371 length:234 start_codon:yes stop_codon:yes gene_type:complete
MEDREQIELLKKSILEGILMFRDVEYEILDDTFKNIDKKKPRFSSKEVTNVYMKNFDESVIKALEEVTEIVKKNISH